MAWQTNNADEAEVKARLQELLDPDPTYTVTPITDVDGKLRTKSGERIPSTLLEAAPLGMKVGMCAPFPISATGATMINDPDLADNFNHYVCENSHKPQKQEPTTRIDTLSSWDWSQADAVDAYMATHCPGASRAFHLAVGHNTYHGSYWATELGATPDHILSLMTHRVDGMAAKYGDVFYRIDATNEQFLNTNVAGTTQGLRTSANAIYTASVDAATLAGVLGGNQFKWMWDLHSALRTAFPTAKLAMTDFNQEVGGHPVEQASTGGFQYEGNTDNPLVKIDGSLYFERMRWERMLYEIWRMKVNSIPIDVIGMQMHVPVTSPLYKDSMAWLMWQFNRVGVLPAITELTFDQASSLSFLGSTVLHRRNRAGAQFTKGLLDVMLRESPIEEITGWAQFGTHIPIMNNTLGKTTLYSALLQSLTYAVAPARRTIKRSARTELIRSPLPLWVTLASGSAASFPSALRMKLAASSSYQITWDWYGHANLARPITATSCTMVMAWFQPAATVADNSVLFGHGNATSGTPTNHFKAEVMANGDVQISLKVSGSTVLAATVVGKATPNAYNCLAVRFDGTSGGSIDAWLNGAMHATGRPSSANFVPTTVYIGSNPDGSGTSASPPELAVFDVHHNADYPTAEDLRRLSIWVPRANDFIKCLG